jgi:uncharacterized membrane-anchored protein
LFAVAVIKLAVAVLIIVMVEQSVVPVGVFEQLEGVSWKVVVVAIVVALFWVDYP